MLKTFIKFDQVNFCDTNECQQDNTCFNSWPQYESILPAKNGDVIKVIVDKSEANFWDSQHLKVGLSDECGNFIQESGTIEQGGSQYFVSVNIPNLSGTHRIVIYNDVVINLISITPETSPGACDAIVTFEIPTAPAEIFEWSIDGINYQPSSTFIGLCQELITVYVRIEGEECTVGEKEFDLEPLDCLDYKGWTLQQFQDAGIRLFQLYDCLLSDIKP